MNSLSPAIAVLDGVLDRLGEKVKNQAGTWVGDSVWLANKAMFSTGIVPLVRAAGAPFVRYIPATAETEIAPGFIVRSGSVCLQVNEDFQRASIADPISVYFLEMLRRMMVARQRVLVDFTTLETKLNYRALWRDGLELKEEVRPVKLILVHGAGLSLMSRRLLDSNYRDSLPISPETHKPHMVISIHDTVSMLFVVSGMTPGTLGHELLGHYYLACLGARWDGDAVIQAAAGVESLDGKPVAGITVHEFIERHVEHHIAT